jgi:hypothetical protein
VNCDNEILVCSFILFKQNRVIFFLVLFGCSFFIGPCLILALGSCWRNIESMPSICADLKELSMGRGTKTAI